MSLCVCLVLAFDATATATPSRLVALRMHETLLPFARDSLSVPPLPQCSSPTQALSQGLSQGPPQRESSVLA